MTHTTVQMAANSKRPAAQQWPMLLPPLAKTVRTQGGGRVSWDEVREWDGHIYTIKCKTDS